MNGERDRGTPTIFHAPDRVTAWMAPCAGGRSRVAGFPSVQLAPGAVGAKMRLRKRSCQFERSGPVEIVPTRGQAAEDDQSPLAGDDLATGASLRSVRPGTVLIFEHEEVRDTPHHVRPVVGIVCLDDEQPIRDKAAVQVGQEPGSDQPAVGLPRVVIGLGMIQVNLGHRRLGNIAGQEALGVLHRELHVLQPALIGRRVA